MADNYYNVCNNLRNRRLSRALFYLHRWDKQLVGAHAESHNDKILEISQSYSLLLDYFTAGHQDPQQDKIIDQLIAQCYALADQMQAEQIRFIDASFEAQQLREWIKSPSDIAKIATTLSRYNENLASREDYESALHDIFYFYWLNNDFSNQAIDIFADILSHENYRFIEQGLIVSALTLNLLRQFSEDNFNLLIQSALQTNVYVQSRALCGIVLVASYYFDRINSSHQLKKMLEILTHNSDYSDLLTHTCIALIRSLQTEQIRQFMENEVVPEIAQHSKNNITLENDNAELTIHTIESNPKWTDFSPELEKKFIKLSELQLEGADVNYHIFYRQKIVPFFSDISHWFLPFDNKWSEFESVFNQGNQALIDMLNSDHFCASDGYSMCIALSMFSNSNRSDINKVVDSFDDADADIKEQMMHPKRTIQHHINQYVHDLYRFYKLNQWQFNDLLEDIDQPLANSIPLIITDLANVVKIANECFNKHRYTSAMTLFTTLTERQPDGEIFQKMGYSCEKLSNKQQALQFYTIANTYFNNDVWTLTRLASCQDNDADKEKTYNRILEIEPENQTAILGIAKILVNKQNYDDALKLYYKLDYLYPDNLHIKRQLAFCAFYKSDYNTAQRYWDKITTDSTNANDFINAAHTMLCNGKRQDAYNLYKKAWEISEKKSDFWTIMRADEQLLIEHQISADEIHFINEQLINKLYD